jgi:hypothetical protein
MPKATLAALAGLGLCLPLSAGPAPGQSGTAGDPTGSVGLDALLKLPDETVAPAAQPMRAGSTRVQWADRFEKARGDLADAKTRLAEAQAQLESMASGGSSWQVSAPGAAAGASSETGPLSYSLRQQIRRSREDIEKAENALNELRVEANLAGVPPDWTGEPPPVATPVEDAVPGSGS